VGFGCSIFYDFDYYYHRLFYIHFLNALTSSPIRVPNEVDRTLSIASDRATAYHPDPNQTTPERRSNKLLVTAALAEVCLRKWKSFPPPGGDPAGRLEASQKPRSQPRPSLPSGRIVLMGQLAFGKNLGRFFSSTPKAPTFFDP